jgi:hypothetical protein
LQYYAIWLLITIIFVIANKNDCEIKILLTVPLWMLTDLQKYSKYQTGY